MKAIATEYKGYLFRSRLEAKWAVFFDACGVKWEYEPQGYILDNGYHYLPDFLLHDIAGRVNGDLYVEVKGKMSQSDAEKIFSFCGLDNENFKVKNPILIVSTLPDGDNIDDVNNYIQDIGYDRFTNIEKEIYPFNFFTIDRDYFVAHPGINKKGKFELFGDDGSYLCDRNDIATLKAYKIARQARFEYGQSPKVWRAFR